MQGREKPLQRRYKEYDRLIQPIEDDMVRAVWGVTLNPDDAEEALQEALTIIWRKWGRVRRHPNPHALVLRICIDAACDVVRKKVRRRRREEDAEGLRPSPRPTPADEATANEQESLIMRAIGQLSRNQATAVILRLVQGESYSAIAEALGCRKSTARKHVERGRERLRTILSSIAPHLMKEGAP